MTNHTAIDPLDDDGADLAALRAEFDETQRKFMDLRDVVKGLHDILIACVGSAGQGRVNANLRAQLFELWDENDKLKAENASLRAQVLGDECQIVEAAE